MFKLDPKIIGWLLEGDPAIRWQVQRDLLDAKKSVWEKERAKVATEGWGKRLVDKQDKKGTWNNVIYAPKYTSTHYSLLMLARLGLQPGHPAALKACMLLINSGELTGAGKGFDTSENPGRPDMCVAGMILGMLSYFRYADERVHTLAKFVIGRQMKDGGWNCQDWRGATHSSFHTSCSVLEGLLAYQRTYSDNKATVEKAQVAGREFFLQHHLYKSHRRGTVAKQTMLLFPYLPQWRYDVLKGLDYFADAKAKPDRRAQDAVEFIESKRNKDGTWPQYQMQSGQYYFKFEPLSKPSRGNTLRALRVMRWWYGK